MAKKTHLRQKEAMFDAVLKYRLISANFTVAWTEPDMGEDLWIGEPIDRKQPSVSRRIFRAQVKSATPTVERNRKSSRRYEINDVEETFRYTLSQANFLYVFGLYDAKLRDRTGNHFHIGFIPAPFMNQVVKQYGEAGFGKGRFWWQLTVDDPAQSNSAGRVVMNIRRGANIDISDFFAGHDHALRIASGEDAVPPLKIVPDKRRPKPRLTPS